MIILKLRCRIDGVPSIGDTISMPRRYATNRIQSALDHLGIDWHSPRYGRPRLPGESGTIIIPDAGVFGNLITPLRADGRIGLDARQPPALIQADSWSPSPFWRNSARSNLHRVEDVLLRILGDPEGDRVGGTLTRRWRDQAGTITLTCWPHGGRHERHDETRDPRLDSACLIEIVSGWRRPLTIEETKAVDEMSIVGRGTPRGVRTLTTSPPTDDDIAYIREPGHDPVVLDAIVGYDRATRTLVACPGRLMLIPARRIRSLRHESYQEGVSAGYSMILVALDSGLSLVIAEHEETHGLDLVARGLSRMLDLDVERLEAVAS